MSKLYHTPVFTVAPFTQVFRPVDFHSGGKPSYTLMMKFSARDFKVIEKLIAEEVSRIRKVCPSKTIITPIRETTYHGEPRDKKIICAKSQLSPVILDEKGKPILDPFYLQTGDKAFATVGVHVASGLPAGHPDRLYLALALHAVTKVKSGARPKRKKR
jgi:hypothetical protein